MIKSNYLKGLVAKAKPHYKTIVLPEGEDIRVLEAAHIINREKFAKVIILGDEMEIKKHYGEKGWSLDGLTIINPEKSEKLEKYIELLYNLRKDKGMTLEQAREAALNPNYFGTLMIKSGDADGMVSGANHSTADTVRPALQIIKSVKAGRAVSSFFIMVSSEGKEYFLSDCAIVVDPNAQEMADIAVTTAETMIQFAHKPKIAMLSFSTAGSGKGPSVEKVVEATKIAKAMLESDEYKNQEIYLDGEMQADAALDEAVGKKKFPESKVAGHANALIFPNIDAGNIGYKLLQRIGGCEAYGPILQGLNAPVNDLSRGTLVEDIVGTVAITCLQSIK
ncbi:MAG: phosphate acetyltransferase [Lactobacillaceae bacterium]|jgi:phosphate acetyltransferase|nr:phosphate acetyltransferase [Lactobacillaceae bacterium]